MGGFTAKELRAAIDRCNLECATMIARHEEPEKIESRRRGVEKLMQWLQRAEEREHREKTAAG